MKKEILEAMMQKVNNVDQYIEMQNHWYEELELLRSILLECGLEEAIKWGAPAYLCEGKNIIGIAGFKQYFGLWFHQGVFLRDEPKLLINAQEGKTKALRQWRFNCKEEINRDLIKAYVLEAIDNQKAGKEMKVERNKSINIPAELLDAFKKDPSLKLAFENLTKGNQRLYAEYIEEAKREQTKLIRLEKINPMIKQGVGLNDKYK